MDSTDKLKFFTDKTHQSLRSDAISLEQLSLQHLELQYYHSERKDANEQIQEMIHKRREELRKTASIANWWKAIRLIFLCLMASIWAGFFSIRAIIRSKNEVWLKVCLVTLLAGSLIALWIVLWKFIWPRRKIEAFSKQNQTIIQVREKPSKQNFKSQRRRPKDKEHKYHVIQDQEPFINQGEQKQWKADNSLMKRRQY